MTSAEAERIWRELRQLADQNTERDEKLEAKLRLAVDRLTGTEGKLSTALVELTAAARADAELERRLSDIRAELAAISAQSARRSGSVAGTAAGVMGSLALWLLQLLASAHGWLPPPGTIPAPGPLGMVLELAALFA